jgi:hypothetical protein
MHAELLIRNQEVVKVSRQYTPVVREGGKGGGGDIDGERERK